MALYFATVLPGLENVLENEIRVKIAYVDNISVERGKVFFDSSLPVAALHELRTADNLYRHIHSFEVGPHKKHLADMEAELSRLDLSLVLPGHNGKIRCKVNASRVGKHTYSRFDAADAAMRGIARSDNRFRADATGTHELEFRLDIHHEDAILAVRLTDAAFRYRSGERSFTAAALRPSVAHGLVWASEPAATERFLDPCCGSGTIISERLYYPYARIVGGDLSEEAVQTALGNTGVHERLAIRHWDARQLPVDAGTIDKVVTNLPFGKQISQGDDIPKLYEELMSEMKRVMTGDGFAYCLTDADSAIRHAAEKLQLSCSPLLTLSLKGLYPKLYRLTK